MGITNDLADAACSEDAEQPPSAGSGWGQCLLLTLKLFLTAEHRCVLPAEVSTIWNPVASGRRTAGVYVCPECGLHWHRQS
jgi:hypothetical protein